MTDTLLFAGSGLTAKDVYGAALPQVEEMVKWFDTQEDYCFYGCSVLVTYEGTAKTLEELNVSVKLIDFAHSFDGQGKKVGPVAARCEDVLTVPGAPS